MTQFSNAHEAEQQFPITFVEMKWKTITSKVVEVVAIR